MSAHAPSHLIDLLDLDRGWVLDVFAQAEALRARRGEPQAPRPLAGLTAALVFHKPSLRTRVSFTVGMHDLNLVPQSPLPAGPTSWMDVRGEPQQPSR